MKTYYYDKLKKDELAGLTKRPSINFEKILTVVKPILLDIKTNGLEAALKYARQFDGLADENIKVIPEEFETAEKSLSPKVKNAIDTAFDNIYKFHKMQLPEKYFVETMPGVACSRDFRPVEDVGLYIPGGNAVLPSTMLMLGIPAMIAGCKRIVVCTPAKGEKINDALLYAAKLCGVTEIYKIGGAQAVGLLAYGDEAIPKVNKIFGPGNQYVTSAKLFVSTDPEGCAIDMPAGPSEVLIIADKTADPSFVAADLLAQAEHGPDSQVVFVTTDESFSGEVLSELNKQLNDLPRKEFAEKSLEQSFMLITKDTEQAIQFSNMYAPEHLIMNFEKAESLTDKIINAGSVFVGNYTPESAGDYASGTNHSLPTSGFAKSTGGVTVESFMKSISFQYLTKNGLEQIAGAVETLAETENLQAHKNAVSIRLGKKWI